MPDDDSNVIRLAERRNNDPAAAVALVPDSELLACAHGSIRIVHQNTSGPDRAKLEKQNRFGIEAARLCLDRLLALDVIPQQASFEELAARLRQHSR